LLEAPIRAGRAPTADPGLHSSSVAAAVAFSACAPPPSVEERTNNGHSVEIRPFLTDTQWETWQGVWGNGPSPASRETAKVGDKVGDFTVTEVANEGTPLATVILRNRFFVVTFGSVTGTIYATVPLTRGIRDTGDIQHAASALAVTIGAAINKYVGVAVAILAFENFLLVRMAQHATADRSPDGCAMAKFALDADMVVPLGGHTPMFIFSIGHVELANPFCDGGGGDA
jgi:hypothetical protein